MADLKNTNIDDNLELPSGTTGERPASPQEGQIRYNTDLETAEFYNGSNWRPLSDTKVEAVGSEELVTNGSFDTDTSGWTNSGMSTFEVQSGKLRITANSNGDRVYQDISTVPGETYVLTFEYAQIGGGGLYDGSGIQWRDSRNGNTITGTGKVKHRFIGSGTDRITFIEAGGSNNADFLIDNVSVRRASDSIIVDNDIGGTAYRTHLFTETGTSSFTVTKPGEVEFLIVAGGGGGGYDQSGGGGGGGIITGFTTLDVGTYTINVGNDGQASTSTPAAGSNGENSSAFGFTALGGGGGGTEGGDRGQDGGSGGGGSTNPATIGGNALQPGSSSGGFGNKGGDCLNGGGTDRFAGGGGGAASQGSDGINEENPGNGGHGIMSAISGSAAFYGGGGAGGGYNAGAFVASPGLGGGGLQQQPGIPNTGGGGGGADNNNAGGNGGSGIVIVRYVRNDNLYYDRKKTIQDNSYQITRDSLIFEVDAGNPISYRGDGLNWRNTASDIQFVETAGAPTFVDQNGGAIEFTHNSDDNFKTAVLNDFNLNGGNWTIEAVFYLNTVAAYDNNYFSIVELTDSLNGGSDGVFIRTWRSGINPGDLYSRIDGSTTFGYDGDTRYNALNRWNHVQYVERSGSFEFWVNGSLQESGGAPASPNRANSLKIRRDDREVLPGLISIVRFYQKPLTEDELRKNFNATRNRYGI